MTKKSLGARKRPPSASATPSTFSAIPLLSTVMEEQNATAFDCATEVHNPHIPLHPKPEPKSEPVDLLGDIICVTCKKGDGVLICSVGGCPVTVHPNCIGSQPKFDASDNFLCPYCWYDYLVNKARVLKEEALRAKKALLSYLESKQCSARPDFSERQEQVEEEEVEGEMPQSVHVDPGPPASDEIVEETEDKDGKGDISTTFSSVSETNDSDSKASSVKKGGANQKVPKRKVPKKVPSLLLEHNTRGEIDTEVSEEVTSSCSRVTKRNALTSKRQRLHWTAEEEEALTEGVSRFSVENKNIPWRKILEFGCHVFDKTRTPTDLKDKWKNITSKEGSK